MSIPQDILVDLLQFINRNEVEKSQLVSSNWNSAVLKNWKTLPLWVFDDLKVKDQQLILLNPKKKQLNPADELDILTIKRLKYAYIEDVDLVLKDETIKVLKKTCEIIGSPMVVASLDIHNFMKLATNVLENYMHPERLTIWLDTEEGTEYLMKNVEKINFPQNTEKIKINLLEGYQGMDSDLFHFATSRIIGGPRIFFETRDAHRVYSFFWKSGRRPNVFSSELCNRLIDFYENVEDLNNYVRELKFSFEGVTYDETGVDFITKITQPWINAFKARNSTYSEVVNEVVPNHCRIITKKYEHKLKDPWILVLRIIRFMVKGHRSYYGDEDVFYMIMSLHSHDEDWSKKQITGYDLKRSWTNTSSTSYDTSSTSDDTLSTTSSTSDESSVFSFSLFK